MTLGTLGFIGFGNMGSAIARGLIATDTFMPSDIHVMDTDPGIREGAAADGHFVHADIADLAESVKTLVIAVKPAIVPAVLDALTDMPPEVTVISIAAGVTLATLKEGLPCNPVIRVMPNTPCMVGAGVSAMARSEDVTDEMAERARTILGAVGIAVEVPEKLMDAVTGLSGSGPAYVALMIDALSDGGVRMGLPRKTARKLAAQTVFGTAKMLLDRDIHPAELRDMVSSPGGTTIEGITALEAGAFRAALIDAVTAAAERSKELGG